VSCAAGRARRNERCGRQLAGSQHGGTPQLRNALVTSPKIRSNAVNSSKVAPGRSCVPTSRRASFPLYRPPARTSRPRGPSRRRRSRRRDRAITGRRAEVTIQDTGTPNGNYVTRSVDALCASGELAISGPRVERRQQLPRAVHGPPGSDPESVEPGRRVQGRRWQRRSRHEHVPGLLRLLPLVLTIVAAGSD
jgi:hypothetical protein